MFRDFVPLAPLLFPLLLGATRARPAAAQELEPRAYSASPIGTTFLVIGVGRSTGGVLVDPSLPLEDVHARLGVGSVGVGHTFDLASRTALVVAALPYARARATGRVDERFGEVERAGWADARVRLSVNLFGDRALRPREFAAARRGPIVGASLSVAAPTGRYRSEWLVNIGSNRWSYKPEIGLSIPVGRWTFEGYSGVWIFTNNSAFYPGASLREQAPVTALQGHVSYTVRPRLWIAFDGTLYSGGATTVNGIGKADLQRNSRLGTAISIPLGRRQSIRGTFSTGATTRIGGDFDTVGVSWQMTWIRGGS